MRKEQDILNTTIMREIETEKKVGSDLLTQNKGINTKVSVVENEQKETELAVKILYYFLLIRLKRIYLHVIWQVV